METLVLGGYTKGRNKGVSFATLDTDKKKITNVKLALEIESPTYVTTVGDFAFSVVKEGDWAGVALLEKQDDVYRQIAAALTEGVNPPCYVSFDKKRQLIFSANYHQGFFDVIAITDDGLDVVQSVQFEGSSVHENQQSSHVHYVQMDRASEYLMVCDLGTDKVHVFDVKVSGEVKEVFCYQTKAGFGPRHLVQHPTLPIVYVLGELSNEIDICRYEKGVLTHIETVSLLPEEYTDWSGGAAIRVTSDGQFVYASNRGHDSIVVYKVNNSGVLEPIQWIKTEGKTPRDFHFNQTEDFIIIGHQDDDVLSLFSRDTKTGVLTLQDKEAIAPECVCVTPL
ncbi:lactonase family protein [Carnobacteriaceae bacterium zg-84]|uniref:lactonase family protein n=1 Tax=Granulicatella sp. zg-84 TaxID=2678503 RepID=UPI0013C150B7|nr:lactonase family protein [Granulicatella sp. zg-84]NEW65686.1 beta-propeller fold lactonase family protein [Granulicatella sp. zg-84]QMI85674.1 lactonase family protein [Carnobacteriaceae bacterium zg-84]